MELHLYCSSIFIMYDVLLHNLKIVTTPPVGVRGQLPLYGEKFDVDNIGVCAKRGERPYLFFLKNSCINSRHSSSRTPLTTSAFGCKALGAILR